MEDAILTPPETAAFLKTERRTLESWRYRGIGPAFIRISGRAIRYRKSDLEKWLNVRRVDAESDGEINRDVNVGSGRFDDGVEPPRGPAPTGPTRHEKETRHDRPDNRQDTTQVAT